MLACWRIFFWCNGDAALLATTTTHKTPRFYESRECLFNHETPRRFNFRTRKSVFTAKTSGLQAQTDIKDYFVPDGWGTMTHFVGSLPNTLKCKLWWCVGIEELREGFHYFGWYILRNLVTSSMLSSIMHYCDFVGAAGRLDAPWRHQLTFFGEDLMTRYVFLFYIVTCCWFEDHRWLLRRLCTTWMLVAS